MAGGGLQRIYKGLPNSSIRIRGTNKGQTVSTGGSLPGSNFYNRTGSDSGGKAYSRTTSRIGGLGSQSGSYRETKSQSPINNATRVKQIIGKNSDNSSSLTRQKTSAGIKKPLFALKKRTVKPSSLVSRVAKNVLGRALNI